jgi:hypothetical protein
MDSPAYLDAVRRYDARVVRDYSALSVSMGSIVAARRAGT